MPLPRKGKLLTFTTVHNLPPDFNVAKLGLGIAELENGIRITGQHKIPNPKLGMPVIGKIDPSKFPTMPTLTSKKAEQVAKKIVAEAERDHCDLIYMGTRGLGSNTGGFVDCQQLLVLEQHTEFAGGRRHAVGGRLGYADERLLHQERDGCDRAEPLLFEPALERRLVGADRRDDAVVAAAVTAMPLLFWLHTALTPSSRQLTQSDIDAAVLHTLETKPLPSAAARAMAASICPAGTTSLARERPSGDSAVKVLSNRIPSRVARSPTKRGSRMGATPGTIPSFRAGRLKKDPSSAIA